MEPPSLPVWKPFEVDGRRLEWMAFPSKEKTRPAGWPAHKPSPGKWRPVTMVMVKRADADDTKAVNWVLDGHVEATEADAVDAARQFWEQLE